MNKNGLMSKKLKAKRREKGGTDPTEINEIRCVSQHAEGWIVMVLDFQIPTVLNHSLLLPKAFSLPSKTSKPL